MLHRLILLLPLACLALVTGCSSSSDGDGDGGGGGSDPSASTTTGLDELDRALAASDSSLLQDAQDSFAQALLNDPGNDLARVMVAALGLVNFLGDDDDLQDLVERFGVTGSVDPFGALELEFPDELPDDSPRLEEIQAWLDDDVIAALDIALQLLDGVSPAFSETLTFELVEGDDTDDVTITIDYALVRAATGVLRIGLAALEMTQVFDLSADIDRIANHRFFGPSSIEGVPYRIYTGPSPLSPSTVAFCPTAFGPEGMVDRLGFVNDPLATGPQFLLPTNDADAHLGVVQDSLAQAVFDFVDSIDLFLMQIDPNDCDGGLDDLDDLDDFDDLDGFDPDDFDPDDLDDLLDPDDLDEALACLAAELGPLYEGALRPWILDVAAMIDGTDPDVDAVVYGTGDEMIELPAFSFDVGPLFSSATWDGRVLFPDYALAADPCVADEAAFSAADGILGIAAADWLEIWNLANSLSDLLLAGEQLSAQY